MFRRSISLIVYRSPGVIEPVCICICCWNEQTYYFQSSQSCWLSCPPASMSLSSSSVVSSSFSPQWPLVSSSLMPLVDHMRFYKAPWDFTCGPPSVVRREHTPLLLNVVKQVLGGSGDPSTVSLICHQRSVQLEPNQSFVLASTQKYFVSSGPEMFNSTLFIQKLWNKLLKLSQLLKEARVSARKEAKNCHKGTFLQVDRLEKEREQDRT